MSPSSSSGNGGILGSFAMVLGMAVAKATGIDYKTLLKICGVAITLLAGWGVNHLINCMDRIDASQLNIVRSIGSIETKMAVADEKTTAQIVAIKKCLDDHIESYKQDLKSK